MKKAKWIKLIAGADYPDFNAMRKKALRPGIFGKISKFHMNRILARAGASIDPFVDIDGDVILPHGYFGIFISTLAHIGKNCVIFQQVTIGSNTLSDSRNPGAPRIGDNCYIGAGAKIIGGITIGNNVRIGANCAVTQDVPDNATIVLGEARIILHETVRDNAFVEAGKFAEEISNSRFSL
jgi:serine O-acetyltransferase